MQVTLKSGEVVDLKTGQARRLIQAGEASLFDGKVKHGDDEKPKQRRAKGPKADSGSDASGD